MSAVNHRNPTPIALKYFLALFLLTLLLVGHLFWPFLPILILSFLLAGIFQPIHAFFARRISPRLSSLLTCLLIILVVFVPLIFFVAALSKEAYGLYQMGKEVNLGLKFKEILQHNALLQRFQDLLANVGLSFQPEEVTKTIADFTKAAGLFLYDKASSWAANVVSFLFNFFMMIIIIFFLLTDYEKLGLFILRLLPIPYEQGRELLDKFEEIAGAVLMGNGVCGLLQGALGGLVFSVLDIGPPILWGGVMGILAFLPILGIGLVLIPAAGILLLKGRVAVAVFLFVFYMVLSFGVEYLLKPKLVGEQVKMHTLLVFLSIMGGLSVFGFLGIIYGPLIITAFLTMTEIYLASYERFVKSNEGCADSGSLEPADEDESKRSG
ncbi:MAG: AI-2E family transporter [Deltaproteobacteria bacterium]